MTSMLRLFIAAVALVAITITPFSHARAQSAGSRQLLGQWVSGSSMPVNKINHSCAIVNGTIYVIGGTTGSDPSNDTYNYSIAQDAWSKGFTIPSTRNYAVAEAVNGKIYIIGGYSSLSPIYKIVSEVLEYDPAGNTQSTKAAMPTPVAGAASFVMNDKIYVLGGSASGGFNQDYKDLVQVYDPATNTWAQATVLPFAARSIVAASAGSSVIVTGGYSNKVAPAVKGATYRGEVSGTTITWTKMADWPGGEGLNKASAGATATKIFITGGQTNKTVSAKTYAYNLATDTWEQQSDKPNPVHSAGRFVFDGTSKLYCLAGQLASGQTNIVEAINTVTVPVIAFSGKAVSTTMQVGSAKKLTYRIGNPGSGLLTWNISVAPASDAWMTVGPVSGSLQPDGEAEFSLALSSRNVGAGDYSATITIASNDPARPSVSMPVSMKVQTGPVTSGKRVLLEEFTGTWCGWCPYGVDSIHSLQSRYPDNLVVASYHNGDALSFLSASEEKFLHVKFLPGGLVDRTFFAGEADTLVGRFDWGKHVEQRLAEPNLADITIENKQYNPVTRQTTLTVKVTFNETVQAPLRLNLLQTETGQNYAQDKYSWPIPVLYPFIHERVVKQVIPDITGDVIADVNPMPKGTVFTQDYAFISEDSVAENCELVAFVTRGDADKTGEVIQVYTEGFTDRTVTAVEPPISRNFELLQNYPNPFNPSTNIVYSIPSRSAVRISVYTMLGTLVSTLVDEVKDAGTHAVQFNAASLGSGTYLYKMETGNGVITKSMTILK